MNVLVVEQSLRSAVRERQQQADTHNRAALVLAARKWERRAAAAGRRARLARAAVR